MNENVAEPFRSILDNINAGIVGGLMKAQLAGLDAVDAALSQTTATEPARDYHDHSDGVLTATAIKAGRKSMKAMRFVMVGGVRKVSPAMRFGSLVHTAVLEPHRLREYGVWEGMDRRTTAGKAAFAAFCDQYDEDHIISEDELAKLTEIADEVRACPYWPELQTARREVEYHWTDSGCGECKCRVDAVTDQTIFEVKTTRNAEKDRFLSQCAGLGYHLQLGWYAHGVEAVDGKRRRVIVLAIDTGECVDSAGFIVKDSILDAGYQAARDIAVRYRACEFAKSFPGVAPDGLIEYELPVWAGPGGEMVETEDGGIDLI